MPGDSDPLSQNHYEVNANEPFGVSIRATRSGRHVNDLSVDLLRFLVRQHHLLLLRDFEVFDGPASLSAYCERWGTVSTWPFGTVLELVEHDDPSDHIFDHSYVPMHWDGMYREQIPEFQIFHCVSAPGEGNGGETVFSNTTGVLARCDPDTVTLWSKVTGIYRRKMEFYDSVTTSPIVTVHPVHGAQVIRYNEPVAAEDRDFVNHPDLEFIGVSAEELTRVHSRLKAALYDPADCYAHSWQTGDIVITDNYTLLHGRNPFTSKAPRHLRRVHVLGDPPMDNPGLAR
ncbi:MAG: TauD/TfdA family dioxygenase [Kutzneria sp.]|nr:TauD/TfdA family dioxygenase [Kutzneria sp.]